MCCMGLGSRDQTCGNRFLIRGQRLAQPESFGFERVEKLAAGRAGAHVRLDVAGMPGVELAIEIKQSGHFIEMTIALCHHPPPAEAR